jgi:hypothetical protein
MHKALLRWHLGSAPLVSRSVAPWSARSELWRSRYDVLPMLGIMTATVITCV